MNNNTYFLNKMYTNLDAAFMKYKYHLNDFIYEELKKVYGDELYSLKKSYIYEKNIKIDIFLYSLFTKNILCLNNIKYLLTLFKIIGIDWKNTHLIYVSGYSCSVEIIKFLIDEGLDIHKRTKKGLSILHMAHLGNNSELIKYLIDIGMTFDPNDNNGVDHVANVYTIAVTSSETIDDIKYLVDSKFPINEKNYLKTLFFNPNLNVVKYIFTFDYDKNLIYGDICLLYLFCKYNFNLDVIQYVIEVLYNEKDHLFSEMYSNACHYNKLEIILYLKSLLDLKSDTKKLSAFNACKTNRNLDVIVYFIEEYKHDDYFYTLIDIAIQNNTLCIKEYTKSLLSKSNKIKYLDSEFDEKNIEIVKEIIEQDPKIISKINYKTINKLINLIDISRYIVDFRQHAIRDIKIEQLYKLIDDKYNLNSIFKYLYCDENINTTITEFPEEIYGPIEPTDKQNYAKKSLSEYINNNILDEFNEYFTNVIIPLANERSDESIRNIVYDRIRMGYTPNIQIFGQSAFSYFYCQGKDVEFMIFHITDTNDLIVDKLYTIYQNERFCKANKDKIVFCDECSLFNKRFKHSTCCVGCVRKCEICSKYSRSYDSCWNKENCNFFVCKDCVGYVRKCEICSKYSRSYDYCWNKENCNYFVCKDCVLLNFKPDIGTKCNITHLTCKKCMQYNTDKIFNLDKPNIRCYQCRRIKKYESFELQLNQTTKISCKYCLSNFKQCPKCNIYVTKRRGCNIVRCQCKCVFCYNCNKTTYLNSHKCTIVLTEEEDTDLYRYNNEEVVSSDQSGDEFSEASGEDSDE